LLSAVLPIIWPKRALDGRERRISVTIRLAKLDSNLDFSSLQGFRSHLLQRQLKEVVKIAKRLILKFSGVRSSLCGAHVASRVFPFPFLLNSPYWDPRQFYVPTPVTFTSIESADCRGDLEPTSYWMQEAS
jgi:hypothetical protein